MREPTYLQFLNFFQSSEFVRCHKCHRLFNECYVRNRNIKLNMVTAEFIICIELWLGIDLAEETIRNILTNERLSAIKTALEKDHAIDCIFLLYLGKGRWKNAKAFMQELNLTLSDGTFRSRMIELEDLGLAESVPIDPLKKYYVKTELGEKVAKFLLDFFSDLE